LVQQKLTKLGLEQRDRANAAEVKKSYISQLLSRKKMPPARGSQLRSITIANCKTCETLFISVASNGGTDEGRKSQNSNHRFY
jgi:predicted transcriptional regulator